MLTVLLALQAQSPRFLPPIPLAAIDVPGGYAAPVIVDLDGDGKTEIVTGMMRGGGFWVYQVEGNSLAGPQSLSMKVKTGCCIGSVPQFADIDGDGHTDLVTGTYQQGVLLYRGLGARKYADPIELVDKRTDPALAPAIADVDGDGDTDLVLGTQAGPVLLLRNKGAMQFEDADRLTSVGQEIDAKHGGVALYDFNGDKALDLIVGDVSGALTLYMAKQIGSTDFEKGRSILPAFPGAIRPGINLKPFVTDWNHDGKPDVLIGDFRPDASPVAPMPSDVQSQIDQLVAQSSSQAFQIFTRMGELENLAMREAGVTNLASATTEQRQKYDAALSRLSRDDKTLNDAKAAKAVTDQRLEQLRTQKPIEGTVWVLYGL